MSLVRAARPIRKESVEDDSGVISEDEDVESEEEDVESEEEDDENSEPESEEEKESDEDEDYDRTSAKHTKPVMYTVQDLKAMFLEKQRMRDSLIANDKQPLTAQQKAEKQRADGAVVIDI